MLKAQSNWIGVDWGTSNLRCWLVSAAGEVLDEAKSDKGMSQLRPEEFEPTLLALIEPWLGDGLMRVVACGMVGAQQGWQEAPYLSVPTGVADLYPMQVETHSKRIEVHIVPGLSQADPANVMRGEETQIAGFLADNQGFTGAICLPGTHAKWVELESGTITRFDTFMTGEIFALFTKESVLRHTTAGAPLDMDAFEEGFLDSFHAPEQLVSRLFSVRAANLVHQTAPSVLKSKLSGWLLGAEFANAKPYYSDGETIIIGSKSLAKLYKRAFELCGAKARNISGNDLVLRGLGAIHAQLEMDNE